VDVFNVFNGCDWDDQHDRVGYRHHLTAIGKLDYWEGEE